MFKTLHIQHFKSIESTDIDLENINLFVGSNGSGKTNLIDAIRFLRDAASNGLDRAVSDRHGVESIRQWSPTRPFRINIGVTFSDSENVGSYSLSIDSAHGLFMVAKEELRYKNFQAVEGEDDEGDAFSVRLVERFTAYRDKSGQVKAFQEQASLDPNADFDCSLESAIPGAVELSNISLPKIENSDELMITARPYYGIARARRFLTNFQVYSIYPNTLRVPQEPSNETYLSSEGRNLASVFKRMRRTKRGSEAINQITEAMKALLPNLERISVLSVGGFLVPQFHMLEPNNKRHIFNVSQMSDGTLRILGLLSALYQEPRPSVIALEEPEQTVNPGILSVLAESIKEVSKTTQVLVTTHSPDLLDLFDVADIRAVQTIDGKTKVGPVQFQQVEAVRKRLFSIGELLSSEGLRV